VRDAERIGRICDALRQASLDALVCTLPENVLLVSGYWPVVGNAIAVARSDGFVGLLAPEDEREMAADGWADEVRRFEGGADAGEALRGLAEEMALRRARVGFEGGAAFSPSGYASSLVRGASLCGLLADVFAAREDATALLEGLRSRLTGLELVPLRRACDIARLAFIDTAREIAPGLREYDVAGRLRSRLLRGDRCDGFAWCMSGPNSFRAFAAFQETGTRTVGDGDFVLVHANSYCGGFWTDITRTFCLGEPDETKAAIVDAVLEAAQAAVSAVRPGVAGSEVDRAARDVMERHGFGKEFRHATGHGVGFAAINHDARPRIGPSSQDRLERGMVFNIEPAAYKEGIGGMRHCTMVAVAEDGAEVLTPFQERRDELILIPR
jgi:Xaa-Pro aminopeptidase